MPGNPREHRRRVGIGVAGVDHDGQSRCRGQLELPLEQRALCVSRREVVEVIEPGLPDRDRARMLDQSAELVEPRRLGSAGLVRVDPDGRVDALLRLGDRKRGPTGFDPRADRDDPRDADCSGSLDEERRGLLTAVEVRVGVDHARSVTRRALRGAGRVAEPLRSPTSHP